MKNVLVTGGAGFIGSNFIHLLKRQNAAECVFCFDAFTYAGDRLNLSGAGLGDGIIEGDICNTAHVRQVMRDFSIDTVVHFAAESHVDRALHAPTQFVTTNVLGTQSLLEAARTSTRPRFHHVSTDEVFGSIPQGMSPLKEHAPYAPTSIYAASKAASDHIARVYAQVHGLEVTLSHCTNNYGPRQYPEKLIPLVILRALDRQSIPIYGDGLQTRDWIHVDDHNEAILRILSHGRRSESYNICGATELTNIDLVTELCDLIDELVPTLKPRRSLIEYVTDRPNHDRRYALNACKLYELGWTPQKTIKAGLRETVQWYLDNTHWISVIRAKGSFKSWMATNYQERK